MQKNWIKTLLWSAGFLIVCAPFFALFLLVPLPERNPDLIAAVPTKPSIPEWMPSDAFVANVEHRASSVQPSSNLQEEAENGHPFELTEEQHRLLADDLSATYASTDPENLEPALVNWWGDINEYMLLARAVLLGEEDVEALVVLFTHPDLEKRMAAVLGFLNADDTLPYLAAGETVTSFFERQSEFTPYLTPAIIEALYDDSVESHHFVVARKRNLAIYLSRIPETYEVAIPHLEWYSYHAEMPHDRSMAMNALARIDGFGTLSRSVARKQLADPDPKVRGAALAALILHPGYKIFGR